MALLAATQGTPERVWSLLQILDAHGGEMARQDLIDWLNPKFVQAGYTAKDEKSAVDQTIQAALGLSLIDTSQRQFVRLLANEPGGSFAEFSDIIHARLLELDGQDADSVVLEAFAWLVVECEIQRSTLWISEWGADQFADRADDVLSKNRAQTEDRRFNKTKRSAWRRWIEFLGLSVTLPTNVEYPSVTERLAGELAKQIQPGQEVRADDFLNVVGARMPYLDRGRLFQEACQRCSVQTPTRSVSRVLSSALRDLADDGQVRLVVYGDARDGLQLSEDRLSRWRSFNAVVVEPSRAPVETEVANV